MRMFLKLAEGQMAPRWFVSSFVSGCHRSAGCGLQAMYGLWAMGHWPLAMGREKVVGITLLPFEWIF